MAQPTILNLDEYRVRRTVVIGGKERELKNMTVSQFIEAGDVEKRLEAAGDNRAQIPILVDMVVEYIEGIERKDILNLEISQLLILLAFIRGSDVSKRLPDDDAAEPTEQKPGESQARQGRRARRTLKGRS